MNSHMVPHRGASIVNIAIAQLESQHKTQQLIWIVIDDCHSIAGNQRLQYAAACGITLIR